MMDEWKHDPAHDLHLHGLDRYQSYRREDGLVASCARFVWLMFLRGFFRTWNRLQVIGSDNLPADPPFIIAANHASHLDAMLLEASLPLQFRDKTFPIAAREVFFENHALAALTTTFMNAFPIGRRSMVGHALVELRERMLNERCIYIIFPEGTRTRDGAMNRFKPGIGTLVGGTSVPVIPCHIDGSFAALPPNNWFLQPSRMMIQFAPAQTFDDLNNDREGWETCAERLEISVRELANQSPLMRRPAPTG
jgi:1-acyl-sn-glycerol-3-phosphate acyltransferase